MRGFTLPSRRLVSQDDAAIIQRPDVPRSTFINSWTRITAFNAGSLIPIYCQEILPGDHFNISVTAYVRMSTPLFPLFSNQRVDTFFFFVPNRLVWDSWQKFMGEQATPATSIDIEVPKLPLTVADIPTGGLFDHFGIPGANQVTGTIEVNELPLRGYNLIFNDWFRDQNLQDSIPVTKGDAPGVPSDYPRQRRAKSHDYFTSALPWAQKFTAPTIPLGSTAPITGIGAGNKTNFNAAQAVWETGGGNPTYAYAKLLWNGGATNDDKVYVKTDGATGAPLIYADLSAATGVAINTFRQAFLVQQLLERDARGGTRYVELIRSHFGVTNPDFRLQRPEYIGGGQTPLNITPIAQTAPTDDAPLGALGGAGTAAGGHSASYAATEHGFIIGLINVRSEIAYQQGLHRMWTRSTRYDYYWPSLAGLGEQAILRQEIYCTGDDTNDETVFGYQERWHEYRTHTSEVTGIMRSTANSTLDAWHLAQNFSSAPTLGQTFIQDNPPMSRVLAAGDLADNQQYLADILFSQRATRPIPTFGTPVTLGRF